jgi:hypothetical protein
MTKPLAVVVTRYQAREFSRLGGLEDSLDLEGHIDLVADDDATTIEWQGDVDAEVTGIDLGGGGER